MVHRVDHDVRVLVEQSRRKEQTRRGNVRRHKINRHSAEAQMIARWAVQLAVESQRAAVEVHKRTRIQVKQASIRSRATVERDRTGVEIDACAGCVVEVDRVEC